MSHMFKLILAVVVAAGFLFAGCDKKEATTQPTQSKAIYSESSEVTALLSKVKDVSKNRNGAFNFYFAYYATITSNTVPVKEKHLESEAIQSLAQLAEERKDSRNNDDILICQGIVIALSEFKDKPDLVMPVLMTLAKHPIELVANDDRKAINEMGK